MAIVSLIPRMRRVKRRCRLIVFSAVVFGASAVALPLPGFMFYPKDPRVGDLEMLRPDALAQRISGKSALVVGGTAGIGLGTGLALAKSGVNVTVVGHSSAKAAAAISDLIAAARYPGKQDFRAYAADLLTVKGCLNFTQHLRGSGARFDLVVLSVGVWPDREDPRTSDGVDKVIALDVLARFLVSREMLPNLNSGARVLSVLGSTMRVPPAPSVDVIKELALGKRTQYGLSEMLGTAGVMGDTWMQTMSAAQEANVTFIGTMPGIVATDLVKTSKTFPWWIRPVLSGAMRLVAMSPEQCGLLHATILASPNAARRPVTYFNAGGRLEGRKTNSLAYDLNFGKWVWSFLTETVARHSGTSSDILTV
eukprot:TRINITY_DN20734_c0_g1_i1.p1 TRINITY_DN20734_c0_g1~~TRINITY_DN20734_c0_g1_i1.p1  ORF type:complete len:366 (-),score=54.71 TRINITY_DN20734_c0_g1_i1:131-1228(-)